MKVINLHQPETELIALCIAQNRPAQQKLYTLYAPKMLAVCRQYIKDVHQAEDVMISGFMKVFTHLKNFENKGSFEGWIRRIMINESISYLRANKKIYFTEEENFYEDGYNEVEVQFSVDELQFLIDSLPDGYKMVFNLYCIEGHKHNEIATMLGITEGTSKSQLSHARKWLQQQINKLKSYENGTQ